MSVKNIYLEIGKDKNNDWDFGVNGNIMSLSIEELRGLREMLIVAIWATENTWRNANEPKGFVEKNT